MKQSQETIEQSETDFSCSVNAAPDDFDTDLTEGLQPSIYAVPASAFRFVGSDGWPLDI